MSEMTEKKSGFRWGKALLIASLALNFMFVGLFAGSFAMKKQNDNRRPPFAMGSLGPLMRGLPQEQRQMLRGAFKERGKDFRKTRQAVSEAGNAALAQLVADPFDRDAFLAAVTEREEAIKGVSSRSHEVFADILATMSLEERQALAEKARRKGPKKKHKDN